MYLWEERMRLKFTKLQGCGNDYIYINCLQYVIKDPGNLAKRLSNRHFGIGGDGLILICPSSIADAKMEMFNSDGSEGKMCGNGIRCLGKYLYDNGLVKGKEMKIETLSGIRSINVNKSSGKLSMITVDMGKPIFDTKLIPVNFSSERVISQSTFINKIEYKITCVSMGNPHCVIFCKDVESMDVAGVGKYNEHDTMFPEGVNTEFVEIKDEKTLIMRVWERGSGETFACGTGACASVAAAVENGFCRKNDDIVLKLKGGELVINYKEDSVYMTGPSEKVFEGEVEI